MSTSSTVTFITGHYYLSSRRGGFHNLADAAHRLGYKVNFITAGYSLLSYLRRDYRTKIPGIKDNCNRAVEIRPGFISYVLFTPWHPMNLLVPLLNKLSAPYMERYGEGELGALLPLLRETRVFVFESMSGLFLFKRFRQENPAARTIYRVSDDVRVLRSTHPRLVELEQEIAPLFDLVSVTSAVMLEKFPGLPAVRLDRHGLDKAAYDACTDSPYPAGSKNAVFVGVGYFDDAFIRLAAKDNQDCFFHIIGPMKDSLALANVRFYGEMPFAATIPYVKHADVGLQCLVYKNVYARYFTDTLKVIQYRYCGLPVVAPDFLDLLRDGVFYYRPGNAESCAGALRAALVCGRDAQRAQEVRTWDEVFQDIFTNVHIQETSV